MTNAGNIMTQADLERLLEIYGGDRTRWPVEARASAGQLVARDKAARRLLAEAVALDRILERAPLPSLASEAALADRIVSAAQRSPRVVSLGHSPETASDLRKRDNVIRWPGSRSQWRALAGGEFGRATGLLAASLALGVFIGLSSLPQGILPAIDDMTGLSLSNNYSLAQIDPFDEDLL